MLVEPSGSKAKESYAARTMAERAMAERSILWGCRQCVALVPDELKDDEVSAQKYIMFYVSNWHWTLSEKGMCRACPTGCTESCRTRRVSRKTVAVQVSDTCYTFEFHSSASERV